MTKIEFGFGAGLTKDGILLSPRVVNRGLERIRYQAVKLFGGCTLTQTAGDWFDPDSGGTYSEAGCTLSVLVSRGSYSGSLEDQIFSLAETIKTILDQKAVYVTRYPVTSTLY